MPTEINVINLFKAINEAQKKTNKDGKTRNVKVSDFANKEDLKK